MDQTRKAIKSLKAEGGIVNITGSGELSNGGPSDLHQVQNWIGKEKEEDELRGQWKTTPHIN
jgi:ribosomal protein S19E (S16A)